MNGKKIGLAIVAAGMCAALAASFMRTPAVTSVADASTAPVVKLPPTYLDGLFVTSIAISADGKTIVTGNDAGKIIAFSTRPLRHTITVTGHEYRVDYVAITNDGKYAFSSAFSDGEVKMWELKTGLLINTYSTPGEDAGPLILDEANEVLIVGHHQRVLGFRINTVKSAQKIYPLPWSFNTGGTTAIALSPNGRELAAGTASGEVYLWSCRDAKVWACKYGNEADAPGRLVRTVLDPRENVVALTFAPVTRNLVAGSTAGVVSFLEPRALEVTYKFTSGKGAMSTQFLFMANGRALITGTVLNNLKSGEPDPDGPGLVEIWQPETGMLAGNFTGNASYPVLAAHGRMLVIADSSGIRAYDMADNLLSGRDLGTVWSSSMKPSTQPQTQAPSQ